jgi:hypothetical protein
MFVFIIFGSSVYVFLANVPKDLGERLAVRRVSVMYQGLLQGLEAMNRWRERRRNRLAGGLRNSLHVDCAAYPSSAVL